MKKPYFNEELNLQYQFVCNEWVSNENIFNIVCGGHKDHKCDENATVYGTKEGQRFFFNNDEEAKKFYKENQTKVNMFSVACSNCGIAACYIRKRLFYI